MTRSAPPSDETALRARTERQLAVLRERAEMGIAIARDLLREVERPPADGSGRSVAEVAEAYVQVAREVLEATSQEARLMAGGGRRIAREAARELAARPVDASIH